MEEDIIRTLSQTAELNKSLHDLFVMGDVLIVNYALGSVDVTIGMEKQIITAVPLRLRAGFDSSSWLPDIGERVLVCTLLSDFGYNVILGSLATATSSVTDAPELHSIKYRDGTMISYDRGTGTLTITVGTAIITVLRSGDISFTGNTINFTANSINVNGPLTINGGPLTVV